jgi:cell wall-associated NlpC family hydrolase
MDLTDNIKKEMVAFANGHSPCEVCALLIEKDNKLSIFKCQNISPDKQNHAILSPIDYIRASKRGKIVAHFHSQKEKNPSLLDNINAFNHNIYSIVYSWYFHKFSIVEPKLKDYLNKDYQIGVNDCYSLVINYFKNELNINIKDYNRDENWYKKEPNPILENFKNQGGVPVSFGDIRKHDVIVFNISGVPSHFAIYLGNNFILYHPYNDKSIINELSDSLKKRIIVILRHKNLF